MCCMEGKDLGMHLKELSSSEVNRLREGSHERSTLPEKGPVSCDTPEVSSLILRDVRDVNLVKTPTFELHLVRTATDFHICAHACVRRCGKIEESECEDCTPCQTSGEDFLHCHDASLVSNRSH